MGIKNTDYRKNIYIRSVTFSFVKTGCHNDKCLCRNHSLKCTDLYHNFGQCESYHQLQNSDIGGDDYYNDNDQKVKKYKIRMKVCFFHEYRKFNLHYKRKVSLMCTVHQTAFTASMWLLRYYFFKILQNYTPILFVP